MPSRSSLLALLAAFALGVAVGGGSLPAGLPEGLPGLGGGSDEGRVVRVVDGDTIHVQVDGRREKVRYIGVDTPETVAPGRGVQCFGKAAARENGRLVAGERVRLERDREARDRYGRLLAYVYRERDGAFVNAALVRGGYAKPLTIAPNDRHARELARLARDARRAGRGLWGAC